MTEVTVTIDAELAGAIIAAFRIAAIHAHGQGRSADAGAWDGRTKLFRTMIVDAAIAKMKGRA